MTSSGKQILLLLWKNFILLRRKWFVTLLEVILPCIFSLIIIYIRQKILITEHNTPTTYATFSVDNLPGKLKPPSGNKWNVAYSPDTNISRLLMQDVQRRLNFSEMYAFTSETNLLAFFDQFQNATVKNTIGGVVFTQLLSSTAQFKSAANIQYTIRLPAKHRSRTRSGPGAGFSVPDEWFTNLIYPTTTKLGPREPGDIHGGSPDYFAEGFLAIQRAVDAAVVKLAATTVTNGSDSMMEIADSTVRLRRMPYPEYLDDQFVTVLQQFIPLIFVLSFLYTINCVIKNIVIERERKIKESLKLMGMSGWLHWLVWFLTYVFIFALACAGMTFFLCVNIQPRGPVFDKSNPILVCIYLLCYAIASICFGFAVSVFFTSANTASMVGMGICFLSYMPYTFIQPRYHDLSLGLKLICCLIPNVAMSFGAQLFGLFEGAEVGVQWSNLNTPVTVDDSLTLLHVLIMLLVDAVLAMIIAGYKETVFPGEYGVPQPWYFPFMTSFWCGGNARVTVDSSPSTSDQSRPTQFHKAPVASHSKIPGLKGIIGGEPDFFEPDPVNIPAGIQIQHLKKLFKSGKIEKLAVADMTLNMYEGQITVLLGHNGAGKTTTMSMLTGFIPPSDGTALVNGFDIRTQIGQVRQNLGLCPQHDILFDQLTVEEHLLFFGQLKGLSGAKLREESERMLTRFRLVDKRNTLSTELSGGMKRKLSVSIALIAGSKIVILDEPSSGLDPDARRELWTVLQEERLERTILLSTHFMDEADVLGDRIAIMASGVVQCCGSSLFLKSKYGAGYHLTVLKTESFDSAKLLHIIRTHVRGAEIESNISNEVSIVLPTDSMKYFEALFSELEERKSNLGISSFGVSVTTMEEVFLKVANYQETLEAIEDETQHRLITDPSLVSYDQDSDMESSTSTRSNIRSQFNENHNWGAILFFQQFGALLLKRLRCNLRNIILVCLQIALPLFFTITALIQIKTLPGLSDIPPITVDLTEKFGVTYVPFLDSDATQSPYAHTLLQGYSTQFGWRPKTNLVNVTIDPAAHKDMIAYLLSIAKNRGVYTYTKTFEIGAEVVSNNQSATIIGFFNNQAYHTPSVTLNAVGNALLRAVLANWTSKGTELRITTTNHPLPRAVENKMEEQGGFIERLTGFALAINVLFGASFAIACTSLFLVRERYTKAKHLQFMSGVHVGAYWLSTFAWDLIVYLITTLLILICFVGFSMNVYVDGGRFWIVALIFVLYAWSAIPLVYLLSRFFTVPSSAVSWIYTLIFFTGIGTVMAVVIFTIPGMGLVDLGESLRWIFMVCLPNYSFCQALVDIYTNNANIKLCNHPNIQVFCQFGAQMPCCTGNCGNNCLPWNLNYLGWEPSGVGSNAVFMTFQGLVFFTLVFLTESDAFRKLWKFINPERNLALRLIHTAAADGITTSGVEEDDDVKAERYHVTSTNDEELKHRYCLAMRNVSRYYKGFCAVDRLSCCVPLGECFGLLGVNGAGKTTTFKMLTGDLDLTEGDAFINGYQLSKNVREVQKSMGYCPQFDALINELTGRETLYFFGRLRGLQEYLIPSAVDRLMRSLQLTNYSDVLVGSYSGGNKRKLSSAVALIGSPSIVCLDEPTTGMDPVARRHLWNTLTKYRESGRTLILTSHSMEECEVLCTKIGIMVNGQFKCLGACQHLKERFGQGYTLLIKLDSSIVSSSEDVSPIDTDAVQNIVKFIESNLGQVDIKDCHQGLLHLHLHSSPNFKWSRIFGLLESQKTVLGIINYSVSQTSLEQIFLSFARAQRPPDETRRRGLCSGMCCSCCCCCNNDSTVTPGLASNRRTSQDGVTRGETNVAASFASIEA